MDQEAVSSAAAAGRAAAALQRLQGSGDVEMGLALQRVFVANMRAQGRGKRSGALRGCWEWAPGNRRVRGQQPQPHNEWCGARSAGAWRLWAGQGLARSSTPKCTAGITQYRRPRAPLLLRASQHRLCAHVPVNLLLPVTLYVDPRSFASACVCRARARPTFLSALSCVRPPCPHTVLAGAKPRAHILYLPPLAICTHTSVLYFCRAAAAVAHFPAAAERACMQMHRRHAALAPKCQKIKRVLQEGGQLLMCKLLCVCMPRVSASSQGHGEVMRSNG